MDDELANAGRKADTAARMLKLRRRRDLIFDPIFFEEPAWDALLYLLANERDGCACQANDIGGALNISESTLQRWLDILVNERLILADAAGDSARYTLTDNARRNFAQLLVSAQIAVEL